MENQRMSISDMLFTDSYVTRVTIRVSLVEQEMLTLPEHLSSRQLGSCYSIFDCLCNVLLIDVCPFVLFLLAIVLSGF
jgi:hypothetical protein